MKSTRLAIIAVLAFAADAEAGCRDMVCHNNPTCRALRNAGNCAGAAAALNAPGGYSRSDNPVARNGGSRDRGFTGGGSGARY
jgi:uncharacterized membrane protein